MKKWSVETVQCDAEDCINCENVGCILHPGDNMIEITVYTTCIGITRTDAVVNVLNSLNVRYSEMIVKNRDSMLIIGVNDIIAVTREISKLQKTIILRKG